MVNNPTPSQTGCSNGFTLLEIVMVLLLLGVLAVVAIARISDHEADEHAAADKLRVHLRFAQTLALNSDTPWGVNFTGTSYTLFSDRDIDNTEVFPGEGTDTVTTPIHIGVFTVSFDGWGRPYTVPDPESGTPATTPIPISIGSVSFNIAPETGFIP